MGVGTFSRHRKHGNDILGSGSLFYGGSRNNSGGDFLLGAKQVEDGLPSSSSSTSMQHLGGNRLEYGIEAHSISGGGSIQSLLDSRSKSAAPEFSRPPPGLEGLRSSANGSGAGSLLFDSADSTDRSSIMLAGSRRPASTGVIGQNHSPIVGGAGGPSLSVMASLGLIPSENSSSRASSVAPETAMRPTQRSIMDLIREDSPKLESPMSPFQEVVGGADGRRSAGPRLVSMSPRMAGGVSGGELKYHQEPVNRANDRPDEDTAAGFYVSMQAPGVRTVSCGWLWSY